jgi:hypothetical protein
MFDLDSLQTLRLERLNCFGEMVNLVFDGKAVPHVLLVGWPGLPECLAADLCEAIRQRVREVVGASL